MGFLWGITGVFLVFILLLFVIGILVFQICLLQKTAKELEEGFAERLHTDTNTLIGISSQNPSMRRLAESLNAQLKLLQAERHRFQQGDQELKQAVTNISHDLRTPLTSICGYLELLDTLLESIEAEPSGSASIAVSADTLLTARHYLSILQEQGENLSHLTEELFRYSVVLSQDTLPPSSFPLVSLNQAVEEAVAAYYHILQKRGITPVIHLPEEPLFCHLDPSALARILSNLLNNALKYSDGDLEILLSRQGEIMISNTAAALNEIQVGQLFDRFYTVKNAANATGLGLSITKTLTGQMGGTVSAWYRDGRLFVCVSFPLAALS